jgi:hypothetical protein
VGSIRFKPWQPLEASARPCYPPCSVRRNATGDLRNLLTWIPSPTGPESESLGNVRLRQVSRMCPAIDRQTLRNAGEPRLAKIASSGAIFLRFAWSSNRARSNS